MYYGYGIPGMYYHLDPTYVLVLAGALLCMLASANVSRTFSKYSRVRVKRGITAEQAAWQILRDAGISDVRIERVRGHLTDHYDPRSKVVRLSDSVHDSSSVAAIGVAAHECGHVIQHHTGYLPIKLRGTILPVVNLGSKLAFPVIILGVILSSLQMVKVGIILFGFTFLFQVVTLPVEFNASRRALQILDRSGILYKEEVCGARRVLTAAAMTYITAAVSTLLQILRLVLIFGRRSE